MVSPEQHERFARLVAMTGLRSAVLVDRMLDLAHERIDVLVAVPTGNNAGVRAVG